MSRVVLCHYANSPMRRRAHWLGLPVAEPVEGTIAEVLKHLPHFGRQPFSMASVNGDEVGINPFLDMVYKIATRQGETSVPVGVVSKNYRLVDHHQVLRTVQAALIESQINLAEVHTRADWTTQGERARFSLIFPPEALFAIPLDEDDELRFRIEIFNSVEGSYRLTAVAGWLRLVCSNGLMLGTALIHLRQQHRQQLQIEELGKLLRGAIQLVERDRETVKRWIFESIDPRIVNTWVDEDVLKAWGMKAAVRVLGLLSEGCDVEPAGELKGRKPSEIGTRQVRPVPGIHGSAKHLFEVSQALSWLAGQRSELSEDLEWRAQVPELMDKLIARSSDRPEGDLFMADR
jgi:hypothetical protein